MLQDHSTKRNAQYQVQAALQVPGGTMPPVYCPQLHLILMLR